MAALIPYEKTRKLLCQAIYNPQGVVDLIFHEDKLKVNTPCNTMSRGGGSFDKKLKYFANPSGRSLYS